MVLFAIFAERPWQEAQFSELCSSGDEESQTLPQLDQPVAEQKLEADRNNAR